MRLIILHINLQLFTINLFKYFNQDLVLYIYYRPQKKFAKVMFLQVSVILSTRGGGMACMAGGRVWQGEGVRGRGVCDGGACVVGGVMHGRGGMSGWGGGMRGRYYEIRSICGRYGSYWNAFLYVIVVK